MRQCESGLSVVPIEEIGLDGDMLEAQAFAIFDCAVARGLPEPLCPGPQGCAAAVGAATV